MEEHFYKRSQVPKFGSWEWNGDNNFSYTNCFDSARQRYSCSDSEDRDLYVTGDFYNNHVVSPTNTMLLNVPRKRAKLHDKYEKVTKKKNWVNNMNSESPPSPIQLPNEEDLYNISPHFLCAKVKKKRGLCFFTSCFGLHCLK